MAEPETNGGKLYTLSEISKRTGISMPTLQRYKKLYQSRLPSVGQGRKQRYPESALPVFDQIKTENAGRRGRPRKDASSPRPAASKRRGRPPAAARPATRRGRKTASKRRGGAQGAAKKTVGRRGRPRKSSTSGLLTLTEISKQTGISYPTLVRYVRMHLNQLPHEGTGRARRFHPQAVDVFRRLRSESGRGGRKSRGAGRAAAGSRGRAAASTANDTVTRRLKALEQGQKDLERKLKGFVKSMNSLFR